jgi:cobalt-zinc-cadmium efflux system membrane fusion protein
MKNILSIVSISVLLFACGNETRTEQPKTKQVQNNIVLLTNEQFKNAGIETGKLSTKNISSLLKVNGKIDVPPQSMVSISVPLGGYLKSTKLLAGMHVNKGEVLAVMEDAQFIQLQQDYLTAKAQFTLIESEYKRQSELNQSKATSDKIFEQSRANYQTQLIFIKSLEEKLKLIGLNPKKLTADNISNSINVYSPITGFVSTVNVNIGKYVNPSDVLFELVNPSDIHLTLSVFEKDINKLSIGQKLFAYTNTQPDKKYNCEIILISKNLSSQNSAEVLCHFEQSDKSLLPGMFMNTEIELSGNKATALPSEAIVHFDNKQYVFIVKDNNQFEMQQVQIGNTENDFTEIIGADHLTNQIIVTKGAYNLLMAKKNSDVE